jgi:ankyrin repeat protein
VNGKNVEGRTPLFVASAVSNLEMVSMLLIHGADPNIPSETHEVMPLHAATDVQVARRLVEAKANPTTEAMFKTTPLHTALRHASCETVNFLMSVMLPEELKRASPDPETYFSFAVRQRCPEVNVLALLYCMCKRNLVVGKDLHAAVNHGYASLLSPIIRALGDADVRDADGLTALHTVCLGPPKAFASVKALVQCGADVNAKTREGYTPLLYALWRPRIAKFLLRHGADASFVTGVTPDMVEHLKAGLSSKDNIRAADNIALTIAYTQKRICPCGKFSRRFCGCCRRVHYCNTACQEMDFERHRVHCEPPR